MSGNNSGSGNKRVKAESPLQLPSNDSKRIKSERSGGGSSGSLGAGGAKRATRASTGAPIALTAKGSLYRAHKDTGEGGQKRRGGCCCLFLHERVRVQLA